LDQLVLAGALELPDQPAHHGQRVPQEAQVLQVPVARSVLQDQLGPRVQPVRQVFSDPRVVLVQLE